MARILGYIAASLDGLIATRNDGLDWLYAYDDADFGEHDHRRFLARIRTVVMGRHTYDVIDRHPAAWAYGGKRVFVVTSRPIATPKGSLEARSDLDGLIAELRELDDGDVWMLGGGRLQMAFLERGALDEIEIFVVPELLGGGPPLFPLTGFRGSPVLIDAIPVGRGCVRLHYRFDRQGRGAV